MPSICWTFFSKTAPNDYINDADDNDPKKKWVFCKCCGDKMNSSSGSTTNLLRHVKAKHFAEYKTEMIRKGVRLNGREKDEIEWHEELINLGWKNKEQKGRSPGHGETSSSTTSYSANDDYDLISDVHNDNEAANVNSDLVNIELDDVIQKDGDDEMNATSALADIIWPKSSHNPEKDKLGAHTSKQNHPPLRKKSNFTSSKMKKRVLDDEDNTLFEKYLRTSIDVKQSLKRRLELSNASDLEIRAMEKEKKYLEVQACRVDLEIKELEKEKLRLSLQRLKKQVRKEEYISDFDYN